MVPTRPILRYHGGKWILAPWIISHFPPHRIYTEAYGGAASVLLRKPRSYAEIYNDLSGDAVNLFRVLRSERAQELIDLIRLTPFSRADFMEAYEPHEDPVESARRMVIRSFQGHSSASYKDKSGFRADSNKSGTTPARDWRNFPDCLALVVDRLRGVVIENRNALDVLAKHDRPEALHYIDPPYLHGVRTNSHNYAVEMSDSDHYDLLTVAINLKGAVVISGYPSELYDDLLTGWTRLEKSALADGAIKRTECLWLNNKASANNGTFEFTA